MPVALDNAGQLWSPYEYDFDSWMDHHGTMLLNNLSLDPRLPQHQYTPAQGQYGDLDIVSHLEMPFHNFSIKRCQGFVRCDMDIDAEVIGWVIGKNGSTIKDLKNKTGCNMWVDQRALKLTITGPDARAVEHAAKSVEAYVAAAPIKAGAVEEAVTTSLDCPPHLLDVLGERTTIARIVKETRAQVVVNKKMARVIVRGGAHAVHMACTRVQATIAAAVSAHTRGSMMNSQGMFLEHGLQDIESDEFFPNPARSRAASGVISQDGSVPASPAVGKGPTWSLFSGPSTFKTSNKSLQASTSQASIQKVISPTDSFFTTFNYDEEGTNEGPMTGLDIPSPLHSAKLTFDSHTFASLSSAFSSGSLEISALLTALKLTKYISAFEESEVDIDAICLMTEVDFTELGIPKGPRLKIMNALRAISLNI